MTSSPELRFSDVDTATLIAVWDGAARDFLAVAETLNDDQWTLPTGCPGWTVGDIVAHIATIERDLLGDPVSTHQPDWSSLSHVADNPFSRYTETGVDERRGRARTEVVAELAEVIDRREQQLATSDLSAGAATLGPGGRTMPLQQILRMRIFDTWVHEQDLRSAIERAGNLGSSGAHATAHQIAAALPFVLGKKLGSAPGTSLRVIVSGEVSFDRSVAVGDDARAAFVATPNEPTATVELAWPTFVALGCGRVDPATVEAHISGDADLGRRFLDALSIAP